jgi:hypothetical protein
MITEKKCSRCKQILPIDRFNKNVTCNGGLASWCKSCKRKGLQTVERVCKTCEKVFLACQDQIDRGYGKFCSRSCAVRAYPRLKPTGVPRWIQLACKRHVRRLVIAETIVKPEICSQCKKRAGIINAHHPDYTRPGHVIWLCHSCHMKTHTKVSQLNEYQYV